MKKSSAAERFRQRSQENKDKPQGGGGSNILKFPKGFEVLFYNPKPGTNKLDVVPYKVKDKSHPDNIEVGMEWLRRPIKVHYKVGPEEKVVLCPLTLGKPCPICAHRRALGKNLPKEQYDLLRTRDREVYGIIPWDGTENEGKLHIYEVSYHNFGKAVEKEVAEAEEDVAGFFELDGGLTLKVRFSEETMGKSKFLEADRVDFLERKKEAVKAVAKAAESMPCLDECLNILPYAAIEQMFMGLNDEDVEKGDEDEDEKPAKRSRPKDDDEDEKPAKKSKPKPKDEDDDEDEKPVRKKKSEPEPEPEETDGDDDGPTCPHGGNFAVDFDEYNECEDCDERKACKKAKASLEDDEDEKPTKKSKPKEEEEEEKPAPRRTTKSKPKDDDEDEEKPAKKSGSGKCPHGGTFGVDCNKKEECDDCKVWEDCQAEKRANRK